MEGVEKLKEAFAEIIERLNKIVKSISKIFKPLLGKIWRESKGSKKKNGCRDPFRRQKVSKNKLKKYNYISVNRKKRPNQRRNI